MRDKWEMASFKLVLLFSSQSKLADARSSIPVMLVVMHYISFIHSSYQQHKLLVCFLYHSTLLMRHKLLIQNFYLLPWHQFTPPHGYICVCNKYYIKYAFFSCSYLEGNMLTSVPKELANLKQLSLVYVPLI